MGIEDQLVILREPNSLVAESYRSLRTQLSKSLASGSRAFVVVSSWGGDGKSMVCANLAVSLTQLFMPVVLIDGDVRRPTLSRVFEQAETPGLTNFLETGGNLLEYVLETTIENLYFLPRGTSEVNPANLLGRGHLGPGLKQLRGNNERCVILDTPPLSACSDALIMGSESDGALMVVNPKSWDGEAENRFKHNLLDHDIDIVGVILNGADPSEQHYGAYGRYGGYGYGYGYGYGDAPAPREDENEGQPEASKGLIGWIKGLRSR